VNSTQGPFVRDKNLWIGGIIFDSKLIRPFSLWQRHYMRTINIVINQNFCTSSSPFILGGIHSCSKIIIHMETVHLNQLWKISSSFFLKTLHMERVVIQLCNKGVSSPEQICSTWKPFINVVSTLCNIEAIHVFSKRKPRKKYSFLNKIQGRNHSRWNPFIFWFFWKMFQGGGSAFISKFVWRQKSFNYENQFKWPI
jgi:hypothetical protein